MRKKGYWQKKRDASETKQREGKKVEINKYETKKERKKEQRKWKN